jgi:hypothetical protein
MNPSNESPPRDPFGFLPPRRATPIVDEPKRWPMFVMMGLYLLACAVAALLIFGS